MRKIKKRTWTAETINADADNVKRQLQKIIAGVLNCKPEEILEENTLYTLGAGSLDVVEIFTSIESVFGIYLEDFLETLTKPITWLINLIISCFLEQEYKGGIMNPHTLVTFVKDILIQLVNQPLPLNFTRMNFKDLGLCIEDVPLLFEKAEQRHGVHFDDSYIARCFDGQILVRDVINELKKKIERKS